MFTPEQEKFLRELMTESGKQTADQFNNALSGLAKRLIVDELPKAVNAQLSPISDQLKGLSKDELGGVVKAQFDSLLEELAKQGEGETIAPAANLESGAIAELKKQIEDMGKMLDSTRKIAETERKTREKLSEEARLQGLDDTVLDSLRGKVKPGTERELLTLIKSAGLLVENKEANRFEVELPDEFGLASRKPAVEAIGDIVARRWAHYQDSRPGTGTGAAPSAGQSGGGSAQLKHFRNQGNGLTLDDATLEEAASSGKLDELIKELASAS